MIKKLLVSKKESNLFTVIDYVLSINKIKHTSLYINKAIENHIESPSLLAIKDILSKYGVESVAIRKGDYSYSDFEPPFICSIQQEDWVNANFTVVTESEGVEICYLDPLQDKISTTSLAKFEAIDKEVILLLDSDGKMDEPNYLKNKSKESSQNIMKQIPIYAFIFVWLFIFGSMLLSPKDIHLISPFFLITSTIGLLISLLLMWNEIDAHNPFIKEVCGGQGQKINCDAVLSSFGSVFLGISWTVWGFAYFATFLFSLVLFPSSSFVYVWSLLSIIALIYIPYSVYYQAKIVKHWCPLCLSILGVILINGISAFLMLDEFNGLVFNWGALFNIVFLGIVFLLLTYYAIPVIKQSRDSKNYAKQWKKLRYNPDIFSSLLDKSNKVHISAENLGIVVGNPEAKHEIIKVCNPYCGPCAKAHPELEDIINSNKDVKIRIIFTASGEDGDIKTAPVAHLMAIQQERDSNILREAVNDWYLSKDYELFCEKYPENGELKQQKDKIYAMRDWCNAMKIRVTPTIYIDGRELPDSYSVSELKNFF